MMTQQAAMVGRISAEGTLRGRLQGGLTVGAELPAYQGPYTVVPSREGELLPTGGKRMTGDVDVRPVPYSAVSNQAGGYTIYIGKLEG